jgi:hypothetical protein
VRHFIKCFAKVQIDYVRFFTFSQAFNDVLINRKKLSDGRSSFPEAMSHTIQLRRYMGKTVIVNTPLKIVNTPLQKKREIDFDW